MLNGSLTVGRLAGATLRIHWSAVVIAVILGLGLAQGGDLGVLAVIVGVVAFFASILAHELAHAVVARHYGVSTTSIDLWALGGVARLDREPSSPRADGWIAAAGPLCSLAIGLATLRHGRAAAPHRCTRATSSPCSGGSASSTACWRSSTCSPGAPLDGGRVVRAVRWARHGNRYRAMREAAQAGRIIGWGLAALGLSLTLNGRPGLWIAITGFFIAVNARAEITMAGVSERLAGVKVKDVTWFGVAETGTDMDADSMIWQRSRLGGAGAVAVRGDDGELDGLVLEDHLWAVPAEQRPWTMLTTLMTPFNRLAQADPDDDLASVLPKLNPLNPVVTVWRGGRLLGVVPPKALRAKLHLEPATTAGLTSATRHGSADLGGRRLSAAIWVAVVSNSRPSPPRSPTRIASQRVGSARIDHASRTAQARLATGSLSLHGKLIHRPVRFHT